ncbi:fasciclin-1, partial [Elysia marginata]
MVFDRVPFGAKSSPSLLHATIKNPLEKCTENKAVLELKGNLYVNDLLSGSDFEDEAWQLIADANKIMEEADMELTKWSSNSQVVAKAIQKEFYLRIDVTDSTKFKAIIEEAKLVSLYQGASPLTLFVFVDAAFNRLPPYRVTNLYDKASANNEGAKEYVASFTVNGIVETSFFSDATPYQSKSVLQRKIFLNRRALRVGNVASGRAGQYKYFANGGIIVQPNIQAGQHVIHVLDRVLPMPLTMTILAYVSGHGPDKTLYKFFELFMLRLRWARQENSVKNYAQQVEPVLSNLDSPSTFFLPTDQAVLRIPAGIRGELLGNPLKLLRIITLHIIPKKAVYTSLVNHYEQFNTQYNSGRVVFSKHFDREAVYVSGALNGGSTVTARVNSPNITVLNGVVHHVDEVLGFVYKTVLEEIQLDPVT